MFQAITSADIFAIESPSREAQRRSGEEENEDDVVGKKNK